MYATGSGSIPPISIKSWINNPALFVLTEALIMDDNEYYSLMRKQNFHRTDINIAKTKSDYRKWEINQGREDAEMLEEKKADTKNEENE